MSKKIVMTIMLGMNRFSEKDTEHPFDMSHMKGYNTLWLPQISKREMTHSTPIYEMTKAVDEFVKRNNEDCADIDHIIKDDVLFIVGRGTLGNQSEEHLAEAILEARRNYGSNAYYAFYTKSYGVVDTLRALKIVKENYSRFSADILFCIDGYGTPVPKLSVSKIYRSDNKKERRFTIPKNVKKTYAIVQRREGFKGLKAGGFSDSHCWNSVIRSRDVTKEYKYYTAYKDGYKRKLDVCHFNMEELVSTIPCCKFVNQTLTVNDTLKVHLRKYVNGSR